MTPSRCLFLAVLIATCGLLGFGYYLEFVEGLEPCPMCMMQRLAFFAVGLIALIASIHGAKGAIRRLYGFFLAAFAGGGAAIATRQIWLQRLPPSEVPECGPGWNYMVEMYPLGQVIKDALIGTGDCAEVSWTFLGRSIPEWSVLWFVLFAVVGVLQLLAIPRATPSR